MPSSSNVSAVGGAGLYGTLSANTTGLRTREIEESRFETYDGREEEEEYPTVAIFCKVCDTFFLDEVCRDLHQRECERLLLK